MKNFYYALGVKYFVSKKCFVALMLKLDFSC